MTPESNARVANKCTSKTGALNVAELQYSFVQASYPQLFEALVELQQKPSRLLRSLEGENPYGMD